MNIVVLMKQVPDTYAERKLRTDDNTLDRDASDAVINEIDEYAIEEGLRLKEAHGGEVTILTMGPERATESIRKALSMGADKGVHVVDPALHGSCAITTAKVLAKALGTLEYDLVIGGFEATDSRLSVLPALVAEATGLPQLSGARKVTVEGANVTEKINDPRYPSFKGIMAAKSKPVTTLTLAELGMAENEVGLAASTTTVESFELAPPRAAGVVVKDDGNGGAAIAEYLASKKLI